MKLLDTDYGIRLTLEENQVHRLCIAPPHAFADFVATLYQQCNGEEGGIILNDAAKALPLKKYAEVILEPFSLNFQNAKINGKLYKSLSAVMEDGFYTDYLDAQHLMLEFMERLFLHLPYPILCDEGIDFNGLCKLLNVHIDYGYETLAEKLCGYVTLLSQLSDVRLVFLIDCEKYLNAEERKSLQQTANYHKIIMIYVSNRLNEPLAQEDHYCILDEDYCILSDSEEPI